MRRGIRVWGLGVGILLASVAFAEEKNTIDLPALAKKARPAVMLLVVYDANDKEIATGTGFLVSSDGKLITNRHVIKDAAKVVAKAENGGLFPIAGVLAADAKNDLVVLKLTGKDLPFLTLGDGKKIEIGSRIAIIGSPFGLEGTLSEGIVSAVRDLLGDIRLLQVSAAISPGSSGSPVFNAKGEVIGVASARIKGGQALNFAVPAEVAHALIGKAEQTPAVQPLVAKVASNEDKIFANPDLRAAVEAEAPKDYVAMLKEAEARVRLYPDDRFAHFFLGIAYENLKFYDHAISAYKQAIKLKPGYVEAWRDLGICYGKAGRTEDAIAALKQAIKLKPDYAEAWYRLGVAYGKADRTDDAIAANKQTIKLKPDDAEAWYNLGANYQKAGLTKDATAAFDRAKKLKPELFK